MPIRIAVGSPDDARSPVWRIWTQGDQVYLQPAITSGTVKLSLHSSGRWRLATTTESGIVLESGDRVMTRWDRPEPFAPGWTHGAAIGFTAGPPLTVLSPTPKATTWLSAPKAGEKRIVALLLADATVPSADIGSYLPSDLQVVGTQALRTLGRAVVLTRLEAITPDESAAVEAERQVLRVSGGDPSQRDVVAYAIHDAHGAPMLWEYVLGPESQSPG